MSTTVQDKAGRLKLLTPALEKERKEIYQLSLQVNSMKLNTAKYGKSEIDYLSYKLQDKQTNFYKKLESCPTYVSKPKKTLKWNTRMND